MFLSVLIYVSVLFLVSIGGVVLACRDHDPAWYIVGSVLSGIIGPLLCFAYLRRDWADDAGWLLAAGVCFDVAWTIMSVKRDSGHEIAKDPELSGIEARKAARITQVITVVLCMPSWLLGVVAFARQIRD